MREKPLNINLSVAISFYWSVVPLTCNTVVDNSSYFWERTKTFPHDWVRDDLLSLKKRTNGRR